ncbi:hypothetical protein HMPREF9004_0762 [Schaalia cardiffensis F0333]|uniref:Uncharacterized protein n=1 Tax=Schaalia cardiffensis F0333 TaxID=888050 RepID=N6W7H9_9ACTO|nr:hypothetical protein HMPREF9004_0762 [Schaalia cardiffensis F0333]
MALRIRALALSLIPTMPYTRVFRDSGKRPVIRVPFRLVCVPVQASS